MTIEYDDALALARRLAEEAGRVLLDGARAVPRVERKPDASPVTELDLRCERLIRAGILAEFPGDGFLGEESGALPGSSGRTWIVDPLDGTRPFIRGIRTYSTLIAMEEDGRPVVGVMHLPALGETYWAARGSGAWCNDRPLRVSGCARIEKAMGSALGIFQADDSERGRRLHRLLRQCEYVYGFMDAYSYGCLAAGRLDLCVNLLDKPWDCAAAACIVEEAGGRYSDLDGGRSVHRGGIVLTNGSLHEAVLAAMKTG